MAVAAEAVDAKAWYSPPIAWQQWVPTLDCYSTAATAPNLGTSPQQKGSYMHDPSRNICELDFQIAFGSGAPSAGVSPALIVGPLPVPMATGVPGWANGSGNDREVGGGYVGTGTNLFVPPIFLKWMQSDVAGKNGGGNNYQYLQAFAYESFIQGTATVLSSASSVVVAFPNSFALANAPAASDIHVNMTLSDTATGQRGDYWITGISTTGFTLNMVVDPTTNTTFSWTVTSHSTQLLSPTFPYNIGGNFDRISGSVRYQTNG